MQSRKGFRTPPKFKAADPNLETFQSALALHQQGNLSEAKKLYEKILGKNPKHFDALHLSGVLFFQSRMFEESEIFYDKAVRINSNFAPLHSNRGNTLKALKRFDEALDSYEKAISINSNYPEALNNRGVTLQELERFDEALDSYNKAIFIKLDYAEAFNNRGVTLQKLERFNEALDSYKKAIFINSNYAEAFNNRGNTLKELKRFDEALDSYGKAISINSNYAEALNNIGVTLHKMKRFYEALDSYEKAIAINPDYAGALNNCGNTLRELKRFDEALDSYDKAISIKPDYAEAFSNRGNTLIELKRFDESLDSYDKAISIKPDYAEAFNNRGNILKELTRFDEALDSYEKAISIKSDYADAFNNRGNILKEFKRFDESLASYEKAISIKSDYPEAEFGKALNLLLRGDLSEGWRHYEYRLKCENFIKNSLVSTNNLISKITTVTSVSDLIGKHVVLITEQGVGDVVMFASMVQDLLSFVTGLDFVVDDRLIEIFRFSFPSSRVFSSTKYNENNAPEDAVYIFIGSLGRLLRNQVSDFPKTPYLFAESDKINSWKNRLQCKNKKIIGISWSGGLSHTRNWARSFSLQDFLKLIPQNNYKFVNIQYKSSLREVQQTVDDLNVEIISFPESDTNDISDLSALLCALDHVVTVQNSNIHLCGALGVHCVGIIPEVPEWRYGIQRDHMIWYETVKLIRMNKEIDFQGTERIVNSYISREI